MSNQPNRRHFLKASAATALVTGVGVGSKHTRAAVSTATAASPRISPNERPVFGWIGSGIRFQGLIESGCNEAPCAAVCDVDAVQRGRGVQSARIEHYKHNYPISIYDYEDYRSILDRNDIDAVVIATPDHWHTKMSIDAMRAGKDVFCEKPMTLTIAEGRQISDAIAETGRVLQVGTMQRTEFDRQFATAAAMVRDGRVGNVKNVICGIGGSPKPFPIPSAEVPNHLDWDKWLGPAEWAEYIATPDIQQTKGYGSGHPYSRTHCYFRWFYEYSGGKLTDWGAHHIDIAMWGLGKSGPEIGPFTLEPLHVNHDLNPMDQKGYPTYSDRFNTATSFHIKVTFQDGIVMDIVDNSQKLTGYKNGVMFTGDEGRFFVNRDKLVGRPVEDLKSNPLPEDALDRLYGRQLTAKTHFADFAECMKTREMPASDAESHHRHLTVCHAANIAICLGRTLTFDPGSERFINDDQANGFLARTPRKGYEISST